MEGNIVRSHSFRKGLFSSLDKQSVDLDTSHIKYIRYPVMDIILDCFHLLVLTIDFIVVSQ
jgi:hypothetical protein